MIVAGLGDLKIFPCNGAKKPLLKRWQKNAQPIAPPRHWPLVGVPTGAVNDFFVVDLECEGLGWLERNPLPETRRHKTPRGWHYLFRAVPGLHGSADLRIHDGVHIRSNGNYIIWWPRQQLSVFDAPLADCPEWLLALARREVGFGNNEETPRFRESVSGRGCGDVRELQKQCAALVSPHCREGRYAVAALHNAFGKLANEWPRRVDPARRRMVWAQGRNNLLNKLAYKLGGLAVNGWIDVAQVVRVLMLAAECVRLVREDGAEQCMATILSGLRAGMERPYPPLSDQ
jgi:hypothetical protein